MPPFNFLHTILHHLPSPALGILVAWVVVSAAVLCSTHDVMRGVLLMLAIMLGFTAFYLLFKAPYIALTQLILYVGGGLVLMIYGAIITQGAVKDNDQTRTPNPIRAKVAAIITLLTRKNIAYATAILIFAVWVGAGLVRLPFASSGAFTSLAQTAQTTPPPSNALPAVQGIGEALMTTHLYVLELMAVILLVIVIGVTTLLSSQTPELPHQEPKKEEEHVSKAKTMSI